MLDLGMPQEPRRCDGNGMMVSPPGAGPSSPAGLEAEREDGPLSCCSWTNGSRSSTTPEP
jgi:hypothetical protein